MELAVLAAGLTGDPVDRVLAIESEHDGAAYVADCINKAFGSYMIHVPRADTAQ